MCNCPDRAPCPTSFKGPGVSVSHESLTKIWFKKKKKKQGFQDQKLLGVKTQVNLHAQRVSQCPVFWSPGDGRPKITTNKKQKKAQPTPIFPLCLLC